LLLNFVGNFYLKKQNFFIMSEPVWTDEPSVLWENGNWMKLWPRSDMSRTEMANTIARLSVVGGGTLALLFRSSIFIGLGMLGLLLSSQMARQAKNKKSSVDLTNANSSNGEGKLSGGHLRRRKSLQSQNAVNQNAVKGRKSAEAQRNVDHQLEYPQFKNSNVSGNGQTVNSAQNMQQRSGAIGQSVESEGHDRNLQSWNNLFGAPNTESRNGVDAVSGAMGAYVALANGSRDQQGISQFAPPSAFDQLSGPGEGVVDPNLVPASDVKEFLAGNYTLRTPFPRPATAQEMPFHGLNTSPQTNPFGQSYPFGAGFPTQFGPAPTAQPPQASQFVMPFAAQAANRSIGPGAFQPTEPTTFGAFASDGGDTSTPMIPPVPSGTVGSNFLTDYFTPRQMAPAGQPLPVNNDMCFAPNHENPLGNVPLGMNGVARPHLCPPVDPRTQSQKFLTALYESPAQTAAGYQFFHNPQQDPIAAQDAFLKWVYKDTQTHFKDKYSEPERAGLYNITDLNGPLGF
jgi:hypothetical protein